MNDSFKPVKSVKDIVLFSEEFKENEEPGTSSGALNAESNDSASTKEEVNTKKKSCF